MSCAASRRVAGASRGAAVASLLRRGRVAVASCRVASWSRPPCCRVASRSRRVAAASRCTCVASRRGRGCVAAATSRFGVVARGRGRVAVAPRPWSRRGSTLSPRDRCRVAVASRLCRVACRSWSRDDSARPRRGRVASLCRVGALVAVVVAPRFGADASWSRSRRVASRSCRVVSRSRRGRVVSRSRRVAVVVASRFGAVASRSRRGCVASWPRSRDDSARSRRGRGRVASRRGRVVSRSRRGRVAIASPSRRGRAAVAV